MLGMHTAGKDLTHKNIDMTSLKNLAELAGMTLDELDALQMRITCASHFDDKDETILALAIISARKDEAEKAHQLIYISDENVVLKCQENRITQLSAALNQNK